MIAPAIRQLVSDVEYLIRAVPKERAHTPEEIQKPPTAFETLSATACYEWIM
jgi:hypothetical protein